jgi:hypothetical protein
MNAVAINAVAMNAQFGDGAFPIPSLAERQGLPPGAVAKVGISWPQKDGNGAIGERFWVIVLERRGGSYLGIVDNDLRSITLKWGSLIQFGPEHILDIDTSKSTKTPALIMLGDVVDLVSEGPEEDT